MILGSSGLSNSLRGSASWTSSLWSRLLGIAGRSIETSCRKNSSSTGFETDMEVPVARAQDSRSSTSAVSGATIPIGKPGAAMSCRPGLVCSSGAPHKESKLEKARQTALNGYSERHSEEARPRNRDWRHATSQIIMDCISGKRETALLDTPQSASAETARMAMTHLVCRTGIGQSRKGTNSPFFLVSIPA